MSKLRIQGHFIGTDADEVGYGKNNAETVEDALDALFEGAGGGGSSSDSDEISNADLALLADELLVAGGASGSSWGDDEYFYSYGNRVSIGDTFDETLRTTSTTTGHAKLRVYKGDTLHYANCGGNGYYPVIITDLNNKVVALPATSGVGSGEMTVTQDGWCFAGKENVNSARVWTTWTERKTLRNKKKVYMAYGDSISSDTVAPSDGGAWWLDKGEYKIATRPICYPRIVATLLNARLTRFSSAGWNMGNIVNAATLCPVDADFVTILMGANDKTQFTTGTGAVGAYFNAQGNIAGGSYTYTVQSSYMADLINRKGLMMVGQYCKIKGITVNNVSKYSNDTGVSLTNAYSFKTSVENVDLGTIASGDVIGIIVEGETPPSGFTQSFGLCSIYQLGDVSEVMAVADVDTGRVELQTTYFGRYRYLLEKLFDVCVKSDVRIFCISPLDLLLKPSDNVGLVVENMRKGLKSLIAAMNDSRLVYVNGGTLIMNKLNSDLWLDDLHPNENGQVVIGNTLATIIKENLS